MSPTSKQQICISCNRKHSLKKKSCECGHVLKDGIPIKEERVLRRNRVIHPPRLLPSNLEAKTSKEKSIRISSDVISEKPTHPKLQKVQKRRRLNLSKIPAKIQSIKEALGSFKNNDVQDNINNNYCFHGDSKENNYTSHNVIEANDNIKLSLIKDLKKFNILQDIKSSPKNAYFHKSKKYRPAKYHELDFEFDFTRFNSNSPFYPNALDDINEKIIRQSSFWNTVF